MTETRRDYLIKNKLGLHARAATKLVQLAAKYPCEVELSHEGQVVNAKSVMGVLLLCGAKGSNITVIARGDKGDECVSAIGGLIDGLFGEAE